MSALSYPRRLTTVSAWVEHIPFGMNLVELLRPRTLVELGTHMGESYCAFCQVAAERDIVTRCYAIDTWQGDVHAGAYGPEVLADLRAHHDPLYGAFSRLVQSTFEDALPHFADGTIDLLHIDGCHSYEAVRADYEGWLPKLAPAAVVLFHDVNVRERGFGVWRLWSELRSRHASFEFLHGHGLGVLAPGTPPEALRPLFEASEEDAAAVRLFYATLGQRIAHGRALAQAEAELGIAKADAARSEAAVAELRAEVQRLAALEQAVVAAERRARAAEESAAVAESARRAVAAERAALEVEAREAAADLAGIVESKSWKAIAKYRRVRDRILRR